jgi:nuclear cap-binding protein subunit 1
LNIFPANKMEDVQPIDRFVVEEYLLDVLFYLNGCRKECASYMANLPVTFRYEYLMAETLFSQILLLPQPPFKTLYYTLVIMDLCKALPGAFPAVVAGAVRALFEKISDLDMESRTRLILWFSHHLSNFQFIWPWEEWAFVLDLPKWAPKRVFVQEILQREVRLSYWDKIKQSIENATALEELLPPKAGPNFMYSLEEGKEKTEEQQLSAELSRKVKEKQTARDMIVWIEETIYPVHGFEVTLTIVVQTLLDIGSKSFTHLVTVLERYGQVFSKLCPDNDKQVMLLSQVSTYWKNNVQMTAVAIDRMMGYRLVSNQAIVRWVFSPENVDQFHVSDQPWEILGNALNKTYNRISDLRKDISNITKNVLVAEKASANARVELEAAESKLSLVEGEPVLGENPAKMKRLKSTVEKTGEAELSLRESLEAKEALLNRALSETEVLLLLLFQSFLGVLKERLPDPTKVRSVQDLKSIGAEDDKPSAMDVDSENGNPKKSCEVGEREQWCLSTLGYLTAFTRQYASEIWPHMEKLESEVFSGEDVHPLFLQAISSALQFPLH